MFTDEMLKDIREKISCPQFGDKHYGEWGILNITQRRTILKLLDYIDELRADREWLINGLRTEEVKQALKTEIELAQLDNRLTIREMPVSTLQNALLQINELIKETNRQKAEISKLQFRIKKERELTTVTMKQAGEVERLKDISSVLCQTIKRSERLIRRKAMEDFAEELMNTTILPTRKEIKKLLAKKVGECK